MPKSTIERRLLQAFTGLNPALKHIIAPAFTTKVVGRPVSAAHRLRLIKPLSVASAQRQMLRQSDADKLRQLERIAPHEYKIQRSEIDRRLLLVQRAQAAHVNCLSRKPWPWPLFDAVRKAPSGRAGARILLTVLDVTPGDFPDILKFVSIIRSADRRTSRIILSYLLDEYVPLSDAARFAGKG